MNNIFKFGAAVVVTAVSFSVWAAKTVYVDCKLTASGDGKSWATAVRTLTEGVNKCSDGDTILVAKGVYDEGYQAFNVNWGKARLQFCNKHLFVKAVDGPAETFIVGEKCTLVDNDDGSVTTNYIRCVQNYNGNNSVVEGFTLMNGDTGLDDDRNHNVNGSVVCTDAAVTWLVNCVVTRNWGNCDMFLCTYLVNCTVTNNWLTRADGGKVFSNNGGYCKVFNTLVANNGCPVNGDIMCGGVAVSSTFINNRFLGGPSATVKLYNTIVAGSGIMNATTKVGSSTGTTDYPVMSTFTGDIRVRKGSLAETCGNGKYRQSSADYLPSHPEGWVSESWRTKDIYGNTVSTDDETIMAGCYQATGVQATRVMDFTDTRNYSYTLNDGPAPIGDRAYFISDVYPTQLVVRTKLATDERLIGFHLLNAVISRIGVHFAEPEEDFTYFTPVADATATTAYKFDYPLVGKVVWAEPGLSDYSSADGTETHPFETLQDALDQTTGNLVIKAKKGLYNKGGVMNAGQQGKLSNYRLFLKSRNVRVIGVSGAKETVLMGAPDPDTLAESTLPGLGPNAIKCIGSTNSAYCVEGFTLTGGYSNCAKFGGSSYSVEGGAITSIDPSALVQNSIITNNYAETCSVSHYVILNRCIIRDNHASSGAVNASLVSACVLGPNEMNSGYELSSSVSYLFNSTVIGSGKSLVESGAQIFNSIIVNGSSINASSCLGSVIWGVNTVSGTGFKQVNPLLCEVTDGAGRPFKGSPALTAGVAPDSATIPAACYYVKSSIDGQRILPNAQTHFAGAYANPVTTGLYVTDAAGLIGVKSGVNYLASGETELEITPATGYSRPVVGAIVNGSPVYFNDMPDLKLVFDAATVAAGNTIIGGYVTANDWYVDPVNGKDTNDGYFAKNAKLTLKGILGDSRLKSGDRVLALPGTYKSETMQQANFGERTLESRAVVPGGVTLESVAGAATTVIEGKTGDSEDPKYYDAMASMHGIGPGAIRCVYLNEKAVLKGFTVKNGHTRANKDNPYAGNIHGDAEFVGGGVYAVGGAKVISCVYDGCAAFRGGGAQGATSINCEFKNNFAIYGGGGQGGGSFIQCLTHDNECYSHGARSGFFYGERVISSTIMDGIGDMSTTARCYQLTNSVFYGRFFVFNGCSDFSTANLRYCAFNSNAVKDLAEAKWADLHSSCVRVPATELQFDANYRPVIGANAAIDCGTAEVMNASAFSDYCSQDKDGGQRVYNGTVDMGCFEADWRPKYAADIARRNLSVSSADPAVVESDAGNVRLPAGTSLQAAISGASTHTRQVSVKVAGTGTLTVRLNDQVLGTQVGTGSAVFEFSNALTANQLKFDYVGDDGYAEILQVRYYSGLVILVQ